MPIYEFQCDECGLQDEKFWKSIKKSKPTIPCSSCGAEMRKLQSSFAHKFEHSDAQTPGVLPPSTGTSDDFNFDKAIGRDAERKWREVEKREDVKNRTIRHEREDGRLVTRDHLVPSGEGDYRVITEDERMRANSNRKAAFEIAKAAKELGKKDGEK